MEQVIVPKELTKSNSSTIKSKKIKGIILAGGNATRLYPITLGVPKSLLPVYNKPVIYYPLSLLKKMGCEEILIICKSEFVTHFQNLLQDGSQFDLHISYKIQDDPKGIADAFIIGEEFIGDDNVALCLGDNIFIEDHFANVVPYTITNGYTDKDKFCVIFDVQVKDPTQYGVYDYKTNTLIEKPSQQKVEQDNITTAIPGLYICDSSVCEKAKSLTPSKRGELEITDILNIYNNCGLLNIQSLSCMWVDIGTFDGLLEASNLVKAIENRKGIDLCGGL